MHELWIGRHIFSLLLNVFKNNNKKQKQKIELLFAELYSNKTTESFAQI